MAETDARSLPSRRKWLTVAAATVIQLVSFWSVIIGMARSTAEEGTEAAGAAGGAFALGFALVPFAFLVLAFGTNHPRAPGGVLKAMGFWLIIGFPLILFVDPAAGLPAGFSIGAIPAMRLEPEHSWKARLGWAIGFVVYVFVLVKIEATAGPGVLTASLLPFVTVAFADWVVDEIARGRAAQEGGPNPS